MGTLSTENTITAQPLTGNSPKIVAVHGNAVGIFCRFWFLFSKQFLGKTLSDLKLAKYDKSGLSEPVRKSNALSWRKDKMTDRTFCSHIIHLLLNVQRGGRVPPLC